MAHAIGRSGFQLNSIISTWNSVTRRYGPELRVEFAMTDDSAKEHFAALEKRREQIERAIGQALTWHNPAGKKQSKIYVRKDADFLNEALWPEQYKWLKDNLELFHRVFAPLVRDIDTEEEAEAATARQETQ